MKRYPPPKPTERMKRMAREMYAPIEERPMPPKVDATGVAKISHTDQIPEPFANVTSKDVQGEYYMGVVSGIVYKLVLPWELDDD